MTLVHSFYRNIITIGYIVYNVTTYTNNYAVNNVFIIVMLKRGSSIEISVCAQKTVEFDIWS